MAEPARHATLSATDYLAFERAAEERHEFIGGEIFAMVGGTFEHSILTSNLSRCLGNALASSACVVCSPDMRVKIEASGRYTYADATVVCGPPRFDDERRDTLLNPTVLFEVLSDSTESYDRGEKFEQYRTVPSLTDYVLVAQRRPLVEHFHCQDGGWLLRPLGLGDMLTLGALGCAIAIDEIYRRVFDRAEGAAG